MSFGDLFSSEKRHYHEAEKQVKKILDLEAEYADKSDEQLQAKTPELKARIASGERLEKVLPEAFATAREASRRVLGEFPYPVQLLGGVLLDGGDIAEMKTGEGKTLTAVMPIYLNALEGKGAHVVTVNEYLASRDASWMGEVYRFLGLTVGCNLHELSPAQKREQYLCDITYTTNSELGFDYLRDNMVYDPKDRVLRGLHYAVLDEVDSILIDEARTPLIISGPGPVMDQNYINADRFAKSLKRDADYSVSREDNSVTLTEAGIRKAEKAFGVAHLYTDQTAELVHYIQNALRANYLMSRDVEYVVGDNEIILVDTFTGRKMEGREFSDGLHQAIQAKENVNIKQETVTLASITYQNFFRLYDKLSGMTGTAKTEEAEFLDTYNMRVYAIPTNKPVRRIDEPDQIFRTRHEKYEAVVKDIKALHEKGQPVLVGTVSVGINEQLSAMLKKEGIPHQVLNAKNDADEAGIIAKAGQKYAVTVATNMAGRGTDIRLGEGAAELGGLAVLGTERHEAARIDNQLRGRSGRQGDPGFSRFYAAMDDDLFEKYAGEEGQAVIAHYLAGKESDAQMRAFADRIQKRAEGLHFDARRRTLEFDNVLSEQREVVYEQRSRILEMDDPSEHVMELIRLKRGEESEQKFRSLTEDTDPEILKHVEKAVMLQSIDRCWIPHVDFMEHLKQGVSLRSYAQVKPIDAYKEEGYKRFNIMMNETTEIIVSALMQWAESQNQTE